MRTRCHNQKVGVHGLSMGGMVATHIANKGLVDFMLVDRSFSSLYEVPLYSMGKWAKIGMKFLTLWKETISSKAYVDAQCYKVIA